MKRHFTILTLLTLTVGLMANPVSKKKAANIAKDFFAQKATNRASSANSSVEMAYESDELYVFNGNGGFVVVSADDQAAPVLGWSDGNAFDEQQVNPAAQAWIESYKQQIQALKNHGSLKTVALTNYEEVKPLVPFKWDQPAPYNKLLPMDQKTGERSISGCPAIALAQVLATVKYPEGAMPRGIPEQDMYNESGGAREYRQHLQALPATSFNWSIMGEKYSKDDQSEGLTEVAKLVKYAGYAQGTVYSSESSEAWINATSEAARLYFGYSEIGHLYRNTCTYQYYEDFLYTELKAGRPVIYSASAMDSKTFKTSGHTFVIDGYKNGYYHVNWGWGGQCDGYFLLTVLNSDNPEEKGEKVSFGYNLDTSFLYGFKKPANPDPADGVNKVGIYGIDLMDKQYTKLDQLVLKRTNATEDFPAFIQGVLFDRELPPYMDKQYDIAWNLYDREKKSYVFAQPKIRMIEATILSGERKRMQFSITIPKDVPDGSYEVHWLFRDCHGEKNTDKWYVCYMGETYNILLYLDGNTLTAWPSFDDHNRVGDTKVNSMTVDGEAKVYKTVTLKFNATNNSNSQNRAAVLWTSTDGEAYTACNATGMGIDRGMSGDFYLTFVPEAIGTHYIGLLTNDVEQYDSAYNLLSEGEDEVLVTGTSLSYSVTNIDTEKQKEKEDDPEPLTDNTLQGQYVMATTDEAPCTKTLYIMLEQYDNELEKYDYSVDPKDPFNMKVECQFKDEKPVFGTFTFPNLVKGQSYRLAVGELVKGEVECLYEYPMAYECISDIPTAIHTVQPAARTATGDIYDLMGRKVSTMRQHGIYLVHGKKVVK